MAPPPPARPPAEIAPPRPIPAGALICGPTAATRESAATRSAGKARPRCHAARPDARVDATRPAGPVSAAGTPGPVSTARTTGPVSAALPVTSAAPAVAIAIAGARVEPEADARPIGVAVVVVIIVVGLADRRSPERPRQPVRRRPSQGSCGSRSRFRRKSSTRHQLPVQPPTSTVAPAGMVPTTWYWVPGPERTLSAVSALAGTALAAPADSTSAEAAPKELS